MAVGPATAGSGVERGDLKNEHLENSRAHPAEDLLTTDQGVRIDDTDNSLRVGERGPTLLEDFQARRSSPTSTTNASPSAWCTPAGRRPTATSRPSSRWPI
ncbi:hypothetical protein ABH926_004374 [Catenulispora sp. GP43]